MFSDIGSLLNLDNPINKKRTSTAIKQQGQNQQQEAQRGQQSGQQGGQPGHQHNQQQQNH
ncbi:unnamed protein product [Oikopleura dioica]|uniref:Uncharacterized protein n=1 Tax=Oikopleura dioica TaxID=34765 RepID=E4XYW3_OIKDI|nr:unnamed protein product [Oikopleura dioica]